MRRWGRVTTIGGLSTLLALAGISAPAAAADPVHTVAVSKDESIVLVEGLTGGDPISVEVRRNGIQVGTATGVVPASGTYELNHEVPTDPTVVDPPVEDPPDGTADPAEGTAVCWTGTTPDILGGDVVTVTSGGVTDEILVTDIDVTLEPTKVDANTGIVRGRILADPLPPIDQLSVTTSGETASGARFDGVAPGFSEGVVGRLAYTSGGKFQATFNRLTPAQMGAFLDSDKVNAIHVSAETATVSHSTVATYAADARFTEDLCPPVARRAVTGASLGSINRADLGRPLNVWGVAADASEVRVAVEDRNGETRSRPATLMGTGSSQSWSVAFPAWSMKGLADGELRLCGYYDEGSVVLEGAERTILKDTVAPAGPNIGPRGGTFLGRETVRLASAGSREIWYTLNGTRPGPNRLGAAEYDGAFTIRRSTTVKAIAYDAAGNASRVRTVNFRRAGTPAAPRIGTAGSGVPGGPVAAIARWRPRPSTGGSPITGFAVTALRMNGGRVVGRRTFLRPASARMLRAQLRPGQFRFQVRTINRVGRSASSRSSNLVTAR
jgi:hypothetical protein